MKQEENAFDFEQFGSSPLEKIFNLFLLIEEIRLYQSLSWRQEVKKRYVKPRVYVAGLLREFDKIRSLSMKEYLYWQLRPLPFGWSIVTPPREIRPSL